MNAFLRLRAQSLTQATRPYTARGSAVKRCQRCQLGLAVCICAWCKSQTSRVDVLLVLHHDEVFKPTNSGRLIADILPDNTFACEWSRMDPTAEVLALLNDPERFCVLIFPLDETAEVVDPAAGKGFPSDKQITLVMLDGTWRQARKMRRASAWLRDLPILPLPEGGRAGYRVRQAVEPGQLSTAEAAACALKLCGEETVAGILVDYFSVFNEHYVATRMSRLPRSLPAHGRLRQLDGAAGSVGESALAAPPLGAGV